MKSASFKSAFVAVALLTSSAGLAAHAGPFDQLTVEETAKTLSEYQSVYIAPVNMDLKFDPRFRKIRRDIRPEAGASRPMSEAEIERKANDLHRELEKQLGKRLTIVDAPGEGVLTVEATVTKILPTRPTQEELGQRIGLQLAGSVSAGGADITVNLSENGQALASMREDYRANLIDGLPRIVTWQDADRAYDRMARKLARFVKKN